MLIQVNGSCRSSVNALLLLLLATLGVTVEVPAANGCIACHATRSSGFAAGHAFAAHQCTACHQGDAQASDQSTAHRALIAFPGQLDNAEQVCGDCHPQRVAALHGNLMHTGRGMVRITRQILGEPPDGVSGDDLLHLGTSPADSLLRKLCAGCHLGKTKTRHRLDAVGDRGGGCLACHINGYPDDAHPRLSARVEDGRCFGCHSRSGRISLSYAGLAESDGGASSSESSRWRLDDGRTVEQREPDRHHRAGMACIDCHTAPGVMGTGERHARQRDALDIACVDCHQNREARLRLDQWPASEQALKGRIPFEFDEKQVFLQTRRFGTPLWNVEVRDMELFLHLKNRPGRLQIPQFTLAAHPRSKEHQRLTCTACHSQWAAQCYGCHMQFDPAGVQWDHVAGVVTPGRWQERRWDVRNGPPLLGVDAAGRIHPAAPGMILHIEHPEWAQPRFVRRFARVSPHTTGAARSCTSCHASPVALGLGEGALSLQNGKWHFEPRAPLLDDGLPADAWTRLEAMEAPRLPGESRPLSQAEIERILRAGETMFPETQSHRYIEENADRSGR